MKKTLFFIALCIATVVSAQTSNLQKTSEQLASDMTSSISQDVQLTASQQAQLTQVAIQFFEAIRTQSSVETRKTLYDDFQQSLQTIMTPETYSEWVTIIQARVQQKIQNSQNINNQ